MNLVRGTFRVHGDILEIIPIAGDKNAYRIEFFGDEVDRILEVDTLTGEIIGKREHIVLFPASHYAIAPEKMELAIGRIEEELDQRVKELVKRG